MMCHPRQGLNVPDAPPQREVLEGANPYLGVCPSLQADWTPLKNRFDQFGRLGKARMANEDVWQFETLLA
jgi:homospermidine synthase